MNVRVQMGASKTVLTDGSVSWNAVVENAFALWNQQMATFKVTWTEAAPGTPASEGDGITSIQFGSTIYGEKFDSTTLAVTLVDNQGNTMTECDVIFNQRFNFDSYAEADGPASSSLSRPYDLHRIALHEFGHVLGLDHPDEATPKQNVDAIMDSHIGEIDVLQADDIAGIQVLYGRPSPVIPASGNGRLANISTRLQVGTGDNVMIGGFILEGTKQKRVIIRALGPSTRLRGALQDPTLELRDRRGVLLQKNDNWRDTQAQEIISTGIPPRNNSESAIVATLPANRNAYTAIVRGVNDTTGTALLEVYDLDSTAPGNSRFANISTRGVVGTGDNVMIGGFIIPSPQAQPVAVRAIGPSTGISGALADPSLELYNANGALVGSNDNYSFDYRIYQNKLTPANSSEAALARTLAPGRYTAVVRGAGNTTGIALVEVYGLE